MKGTQLLEIYALEIQMYTEQKNNKKLKALYEQSLHIRSAIPHPLIMGVIRECGGETPSHFEGRGRNAGGCCEGKMHLREGEFDKAHTDFFEAFKNYDESGNLRRMTCLKYVVLANMLMKVPLAPFAHEGPPRGQAGWVIGLESDINPFDSQEAKPYKNDPEILAMTNLVSAYQNNDIAQFELILRTQREKIMADPFIREHITGHTFFPAGSWLCWTKQEGLAELLRNIRTQVLVKLIRPYTRIQLSYLAAELNIPLPDVSKLLVHCILDKWIRGRIDEVKGVLEVEQTAGTDAADRYAALQRWTANLYALHLTIANRAS